VHVLRSRYRRPLHPIDWAVSLHRQYQPLNKRIEYCNYNSAQSSMYAESCKYIIKHIKKTVSGKEKKWKQSDKIKILKAEAITKFM